MSGRALVLSGTCPGQLSGAVCEEGTCPGVGRLSGHLCMHCFYPKSVLVYVYNFYLLVKSLIVYLFDHKVVIYLFNINIVDE